jgi:hypothetical protein
MHFESLAGAEHAAGRLDPGDGDNWKARTGSCRLLEELPSGDPAHALPLFGGNFTSYLLAFDWGWKSVWTNLHGRFTSA